MKREEQEELKMWNFTTFSKRINKHGFIINVDSWKNIYLNLFFDIKVTTIICFKSVKLSSNSKI